MTKELPDWLDPTPWLDVEYTASDVERALYCTDPGERELATLLSPAASDYLEPMAQRAQSITRRHFGRTMKLYTPLYLSNFCNGGCLYCGIAADRRAKRAVLDEAQLRHEMQAIKDMHLEELVLLTGERIQQTGFSRIRRTGDDQIHTFAQQTADLRALLHFFHLTQDFLKV